jgi:hypothetical protein
MLLSSTWGCYRSNLHVLCRKVMLALGTLATFTFYQWTQACTSKWSFLLSAIVLFFVLLMLAGASFLILFISKKPGGLERLFSKDHSYSRRWGSMYNTLNEGQLYFAVALWINVLIRSAITAFGQSNGMAQVIAMIILEFLVCVCKSTSTHEPVTRTNFLQVSSATSRIIARGTTESTTSSKVPGWFRTWCCRSSSIHSILTYVSFSTLDNESP